jgi:hypothetical protein
MIPKKYSDVCFLERLYEEYFSVHEETCGIINSNGIFKVVNISKRPDSEFRISNHYFSRKKCKTTGTIHTHFDFWSHLTGPSEADFRFAKANKLKLNILIIVWKGEFIFFNSSEIIGKIKVKIPLRLKIMIFLSYFITFRKAA